MAIQRIITAFRFTATQWIDVIRSAARSSHEFHGAAMDVEQLEARVLYSASPLPMEAVEAAEVEEVDTADPSSATSQTENQTAGPDVAADDIRTSDDSLALLDELTFELLPTLEAESQPFVTELDTLSLNMADGLSLENTDTVSRESDGADSQISAVRRELVILDPGVQNSDALRELLLSQQADGRVLEFVVLDANRDGVEQITEILAGQQDLDAVHVLSHGTTQGLQLGSTWLDGNTINDYADAIRGWQGAFVSEADLLLYGCDLAGSDAGRSIVDSLSHWTGTDVAASTNLTGYALFGGDWQLEYQTGHLETRILANDQTQADWQGLMAVSLNSTSSAATASDGAASLTWSHTVNSGSNRILTVGLSLVAGQSTSVTYGGVAMTLVGRHTGVNGHTSEIWRLLSPNVGAANIAATFDASRAAIGGAAAFDGVDQTTPTGTFVGNSAANGTTASVNVTSAAGELVIDTLFVDIGTSVTALAGQTERWELTNGRTGAGSTEAGATSVTMSWTLGADDEWNIGAVSLKAAAANSAPSITLPGAALNYTENDPATIIDATATASDTDSANFDTGTLTVDYSVNGTINDRLAIRNQGTNPGEIGVSGSNVTYNFGTGAITIGTWTGGTGTTPLVITFNASSSPAAAQALMRNITYANVSEAPSTAARTVRFVLTDGDGGTSAAATKAINLTTIADTPSVTNATTNEDTQSTSGLVITRNVADGAEVTHFKITGITNGTLYKNDGTTQITNGTFITFAEGNAGLKFTPTANFNGAGSFTVQASTSNSDAGLGGSTVNATITVNAVNDAPVRTAGTPAAINVNEDSANATAITLGMSGLTYGPGGGTDEAGQTLTYTVTAIPAHMTLWKADGVTQVTASTVVTLTELQGLKYKTVANANGSGNLTWTVVDNGGTANGGLNTLTETLAITVNAENDTPLNTVPTAQMTGKNIALVFSAAQGNQISIGDVDAGGSSMQVTLTATNGTITLAGTAGLSFAVGSGTANVTMTFSGTIANINTALNGLSFAPTTDHTGSASLQIVTNDQGNTGSGGALGDTDAVPISITDASLWVSTEGNSTSSAGSGNLSWTDGSVVSFGNPNLALGSGTTSGTFSIVSAMDSFAADGSASIDGLHHVSRNVTVGTANPVTLQAGDVLLSTSGNETLGGVAVTSKNIVLFRPTEPGNYSSGTFSVLISSPGNTGASIREFALVESLVTVGATNLLAGDFLIVMSGGTYDKDITLFRPTAMGTNPTGGTITELIDGASTGINFGSAQIAGIEIIAQTTLLGGQTLNPGQILVTLANVATVGTNSLSVVKDDIFVLNVTATGRR